MDLVKDFTLMESQKKANEEIGQAIGSINDIYKEWKKIQRRKNAVNLVTTSVNKLTTIDPSVVDHIHDAAKTKLSVIMMRCMNLPPWMDVEAKRITYRRLYPLLNKLQRHSPNSGTDGNLKDIITTRLSASITATSDSKEDQNVFVAYEPKINAGYMRFIFGDENRPEHIAKMQTLSLPEDYDTLLNIIRINHQKACERYNKKGKNDE